MKFKSTRNFSHGSGSDQFPLSIDNPGMSVRVNNVRCCPEFIDRAVKYSVSLGMFILRFCVIFQNSHPSFGPFVGHYPLPVGGGRHGFLIVVTIHLTFFRSGTCNLEIICRLSFCVVICPSCRMTGDQFHQPVFPISKVPFSRICLHQIPFSLVLIIPVNPVAEIRAVRLLRHRNISRHIAWIQLIIGRFPVIAQKLEQGTGQPLSRIFILLVYLYFDFPRLIVSLKRIRMIFTGRIGSRRIPAISLCKCNLLLPGNF